MVLYAYPCIVFYKFYALAGYNSINYVLFYKLFYLVRMELMMSKPSAQTLENRRDDAQLLADEAKYCSFGDTVHYVNPPKIFDGCEGSYMYDKNGTP
ncbi:MAG: hypothetical protein J6586_06365, partial [Snodgrassella sp.]|nr:hypothetical protein [Snodgrassella sp.]